MTLAGCCLLLCQLGYNSPFFLTGMGLCVRWWFSVQYWVPDYCFSRFTNQPWPCSSHAVATHSPFSHKLQMYYFRCDINYLLITYLHLIVFLVRLSVQPVLDHVCCCKNKHMYSLVQSFPHITVPNKVTWSVTRIPLILDHWGCESGKSSGSSSDQPN